MPATKSSVKETAASTHFTPKSHAPSDFVLISTDNVTYNLHRANLLAQSQTFQDMLNVSSDSAKGEVRLKVQPGVGDFECVRYQAKLGLRSVTVVSNLHAIIAQDFQLALDILALANKYDMQRLLHQLEKAFVRRFGKITGAPDLSAPRLLATAICHGRLSLISAIGPAARFAVLQCPDSARHLPLAVAVEMLIATTTQTRREFEEAQAHLKDFFAFVGKPAFISFPQSYKLSGGDFAKLQVTYEKLTAFAHGVPTNSAATSKVSQTWSLKYWTSYWTSTGQS